VSSFLAVPDVRTARDTRLLARILRGDRSQRLISRRLFDRCMSAIHPSEGGTDREAECLFLQSFMEPGKHALIRSVMLGMPEPGRYDFMHDVEVRTGYITHEKAEVEAGLMMTAVVRKKRTHRYNV
jgi:hypothetical protein